MGEWAENTHSDRHIYAKAGTKKRAISQLKCSVTAGKLREAVR